MTGLVVWITGKPSSGKTTLALAVHRVLVHERTGACVLDGDRVRAALVPEPGYDPKSRDEFYATLANLAALLARQDLVVLVAATAHLRQFRRRARSVAPQFLEVWVAASQEDVEARDAKGLYAAVREGRIGGVPGADLAFETPEHADVVVHGGQDESGISSVVAAIRQELARG